MAKHHPRAGGHPVYEILGTEVEPVASDHELLERALQGAQDQILSLEQIRERLLKSFSEVGESRPGLLRSIHRHVAGGSCQACREFGPLLERRGRQLYRVRLSGERVTPEPSFSLSEIMELAERAGVFTTLRPLLVEALQAKNLSQKEAEMLLGTLPTPKNASLSPDHLQHAHLLLKIWPSRDLLLWQTAEAAYLRHVRDPELEAVFEAVISQRVLHMPGSLRLKALLADFLAWFLGQRPEREQEYRLRRQALDQAAEPSLPPELLTSLDTPAALAQTLESLVNLPGLSANPAEATLDDLMLATGLLALLRPDAGLTVSRPVLWALSLLASEGLIPSDLPLQPATVIDLTHILLWAQDFCRTCNQAWRKPWLTPRRLDRLLYALRDFDQDLLERYVKGKELPFLSESLSDESLIHHLHHLLMCPHSNEISAAIRAWKQWMVHIRTATLLQIITI